MKLLGTIDVLVRARTDKLNRDFSKAEHMSKKTAGTIQKHINSISVAAIGTSFVSLTGLVKVFGDGFNAVEKMNLSAASLAATITSFAKDSGKNLAGTYEQAYNYSELLVLKMEEWNAKTVATGENLSAMVETLIQSGILLDINNEKQERGFLAIANALALITQGQNQDIQFRQEIRGLTQGEIRTTNLLARLLEQRIGGNLKKHVELWKEEGTLIENAGALLEGFQAATGDLASTWLAVGTTLETMYNKVLRGMLKPVYEDIIGMGKDITLNILEQDAQSKVLGNTLKTIVYKGWQDIKNITESIVDIIESIEAPLRVTGGLVGTIFDGWGMIFAILPAITERVKLIVQSMFDVVHVVARVGDAVWNLASFNFELAEQSFKMAKDAWYESGNKTAEAFSTGFLEEIDKRLATYSKDLSETIKKVKPPEMKPPPVKSDDSWIKNMQAQESFAIKMAEFEQERLNKRYELEQEINVKIHDELLSDTEFRLQELDKQFLAADSFIKNKAMLDEWYVKQYEEIVGTQEQAYMDLYNNFGILSQETYDQLYNQYVKDRDDFIALTGDKEAAQEVFAQRLNALNKEMETSEKSWTDGAKAGLDDYAKSAMDVVGNVQNAFESGFKSMEDALVDFCMTGKLDFASFANSIIRDMVRIFIQSQITGVLAGALAGAFAPTPTVGSTSPMSGVQGGGVPSSAAPMAQGGVFNSPNLSARSNSIVDSPTLFSFAQGRGLMGEAGPEAIMPLTRLPGGDLGVKAKPGGGESKRPMEIHIHEAPGTQTRTEQSEDGTRLDVIIEQVEQAMTGRMGRGTGLAPFMDSRYARTY